MCDTFGVINNKYALFAKNSDRSPNEPQVIQFIRRHKNKNKKLKTTYIEIEEVEEVYSILISRPSWLWGCEMGVNEYGLCIGNEAIFTKGKYNKTGLTGMDLVRLALERCKTSKEAKDLIIELIKKYNQGGNCGYDHNFYYDNSFLIMDRNNIYVLETSKDKFNYEKKDMWSISNLVTLDNSNIKEDKLYRYFSGSKIRNKLVKDKLNKDIDVLDAFNILRLHNSNNYIKKGSVKSVCMHAGGIVGDHTTSSMVIKVDKNIDIYFTGTSLPCKSVFKQFRFNDKVLYPVMLDNNPKYWYEQEFIKRKIDSKKISSNYYQKREEYEQRIINTNISLKEQLKLERELNNILLSSQDKIKKGIYYRKYFKKKNKLLKENYYA